MVVYELNIHWTIAVFIWLLAVLAFALIMTYLHERRERKTRGRRDPLAEYKRELRRIRMQPSNTNPFGIVHQRKH